jgi:hypothetical protein
MVGFAEARPMQQVLIKNVRMGTIMSLSRTMSVLAEFNNAGLLIPAVSTGNRTLPRANNVALSLCSPYGDG